MLSASLEGRVWHVGGDVDPRRVVDSIVIEADPTRPSRVRAMINGTAVDSVNVKEIDTIFVSAGHGDDRVLINLPEQFNRIRVRADGGRGNDTLIGGAGRDELRGGVGHDLLDGGAGADVLRGQQGHDDLAGDDGDDAVSGDAGADTLAGGWGRDNLTGGDDADQLRGGADGDFLYGNAGADVLRGGDGRDRLLGGGDRDRLYRETSRDHLVGASNEILNAGDDDGAVLRMSSRDAWAQQIINAGLRAHRGEFGQPGGGFVVDDFGLRGGGGGGFALVGTPAGTARLTTTDALTFATNNVTGLTDQDFSGTNVQVAGVDEADLVETDGRYIYSISGGKLVITDASNTRSLRVASSTSLGNLDRGGGAIGMYLHGSTLTMISSVFEPDDTRPEPDPVEPGSLRFDSIWHPGKMRTEVASWDVANPDAPSKIAMTTLDGSYQSSRLIDGRLAVVVNNGMAIAYPQMLQDGDVWRTETEDEYADRVRAEVAGFSPRLSVTRAGRTSDKELIDPTDVYVPAEAGADTAQLTTVALIDVANVAAGAVSSASYAGTGGTTYVSRDALYVVGNGWGETPSSVVKFGLVGTSVTVEATGSIDGHVNNQFSLDEHGQHFRAAFTRGFGGESTNGVVVFDQVGDELAQVGELEGLAKGESIFAARFIGDEAYLVTFEQKDPLFTIDLSDPTNPSVVGQLVIPGFSRYLHPLDANHLIGVGRNADENGVVQELQLSLFDVTDRANPRRVDTCSIDVDGWSGSAAEWDHLAFQYNPQAGVILLPVTNGRGGSHLELIRVSATSGFDRVGEVATDDNFLSRAVWIGSTVFAVGDRTITSADIGTATEHDEVELE
jgi:uncharacterized secreted protein with C-terminal beta-propeller domain